MPTHHNADFFSVAQNKIAAALRRARGGPIREADLVRIAQFLIEGINAKVAQRAASGEPRDAAITAELLRVAGLAGGAGLLARIRDAVLIPHAPAPTVATPVDAIVDRRKHVVHPNLQKEFAVHSNLQWPEIEVVLLSEKQAQFVVCGQTRAPQSYAELGFSDRRNDLPARAWHLLRDLAEKNGQLPEPTVKASNRTTAGKEWQAVAKRIQAIRSGFHQLFPSVPGDPVNYIQGFGYRTNFKVRCAKSYHDTTDD